MWSLILQIQIIYWHLYGSFIVNPIHFRVVAKEVVFIEVQMAVSRGQKSQKGCPSPLWDRIGFSYYRKDPRIVTAGIEYRDTADIEYQKNDLYGSTAPGGTKCFRSTDGGRSWTRLSIFGIRQLDSVKVPIGAGVRPFYFGPPRQDPVNINRIYLPNYDGAWVSDDAGKTFARKISFGGDPHELWINPFDNRQMIGSQRP